MQYLTTQQTRSILDHGRRGHLDDAVLPTTENFRLIMVNDMHYRGVRFNELTGEAELHHKGGIVPWDDTLAAVSRNYIETSFGIRDRDRHDDALLLLFRERRYNPIIEIVEQVEWDGVERCEHFLIEWAGAADTPYNREVSRLIFAGGIDRLYHPGGKFDVVPVLVGKQGSGKTTLVQTLALNDAFHANLIRLDGSKEAIETLQGVWIAEIGEVAALKRSDVESIKSFTTQTADRYRRPYARFAETLPRRCIFIGTGNSPRFLSDKTGNRRFYPVEVHSDGRVIFARREEIRDYALQCWAEALDKMQQGRMPTGADQRIAADALAAQEAAAEDDWRVGVIEDYLSQKLPGELTCVKEVFDRAVWRDDPTRNPSHAESVELGQILDALPDWERQTVRRTVTCYGQQRCWMKRKP